MKDTYDKALKEVTLLTAKVSNKNAEILKKRYEKYEKLFEYLPQKKAWIMQKPANQPAG